MMEPERLLEILSTLGALKDNTRHSWTLQGRHESVAEHSWRLAVMALLLPEEFPELDMQRAVEMCLIHDWGEAICGDVPAFWKNGQDEREEQKAVETLLSHFPPRQAGRFAALFQEMQACTTGEAQLWKALDMLEGLIQHNEAGTDSWIELEHTLNRTYGAEACGAFDYTHKLGNIVRAESARLSAESQRKDTL